MGYRIIKPNPCVASARERKEERMAVTKTQLTFSLALAERLGLRKGKALQVMYDDGGFLCFSVKDKGFPDSFPVGEHNNAEGRCKQAVVWFASVIREYGLAKGRYRITREDGIIYTTDIRLRPPETDVPEPEVSVKAAE